MLLVVFWFITTYFAQSVAKLDTVNNLYNIKPQYVFDKNNLYKPIFQTTISL